MHLPNGAIITSVKAYWFRDDAAAYGDLDLFENILGGGSTLMATVDSNSTAGNHTVEDTSITNATISNANSYGFSLALTTNNSTTDINIQGIDITYTILQPLP